MATGLFLGAGASYEVGMPLVWDLTAELKAWLTPDKLRELNRGWRTQNGGHPDEVIDNLARVLILPDLHYESILGFLETNFRRHSGPRHDYHGLYAWLVEMVYWILYYRHTKNVIYIERNLPLLDGIAKLAERNHPLWVFSLNHDLIIECLAARHGIPLSAGFTSTRVSLPRRNSDGVKTGELHAEVITGEQLEKSGMPFLSLGTPGINLIKVHGALDVFTFRNGEDLLKLIPIEATPAGIIETLRAANQELLYFEPLAPNKRAKVTNEIAYADDGGEMQFLRRSLLAGSFKFDNRASQVLPMRLLDYFKSHMNNVSELVCVGYGFGDVHINNVIRSWIEFSADRNIDIVSPGIKNIPPFLLHVAPQVKLSATTATDYFDKIGGITRTKRELLEKRLAAWARGKGIGPGPKNDFQAFAEQHQHDRIAKFVEKMKSLPWRDGDIDLAALGMTREELIKQWSRDVDGDIESFLEEFLTSRESKPT
jgi:hypothetical protein